MSKMPGTPTNVTIQFQSETAATKFWSLVFNWDGYPYPRGGLQVGDQHFEVMLVNRHRVGVDCRDYWPVSQSAAPEDAHHLNPGRREG